MKKFIYLLLIVSLFFTSCSDENEEQLPDYAELAIIDISQESDFDLMVLAQGSNDYFYVKANSTNNEIPEVVLYHNSKVNKDMSLFIDQDGNLDKVVVDDNIFIFRNFNENYLDIGVISSSGDFNIIRGLETNYNWNSNLLSKNSNLKSSINVLIKNVGDYTSAASCGFAAIHAKMGNLPFFVLSGFECFVGIGELLADQIDYHYYASPNEIEFWDNFFDAYDTASTVFTCSHINVKEISECFSSVVNFANNVFDEDMLTLEYWEDGIQSLVGTLSFGHGDIQINLTWTNNADLDLIVIDPNGEKIFYNHKNSISGGILDIDNRTGYGPENIYWPPGEAPDGIYKVYVSHYHESSASSSNYILLIDAFGFLPRTDSGSIDRGDLIHIADISRAGWKAVIDKKPISITTNLIKQ